MTEATVLVVDNYDSFVYNLVQYVGEALVDLGHTHDEAREALVVRRNDALTVGDIERMAPDAVVVSPGPGTPESAGVCVPLFRETSYPTLGVCLGHQALCAANGAPVGHAPDVVHGKPSVVTHDGAGVFRDLPDALSVGRYHSLSVERGDLPDALAETARTEDERGVVMGVRHAEKPHEGVQFHPESILTEHGRRMVRTFVGDAL
ncbi:anthranilate synthase component II [Halosegnis marinus]|uniref:Anthranilate synthase component II n=1 Tax=Halosegnis marinus TaxID=3034023 RepID=A0ABD5ZLH9_9EURY|nr:aminodeoxychorismate/anthranilate synthase component II [Halosegnis sp. DT85]